MKRLTTHLRSNAVAYVALFFAVSSTGALAAGQLAKNSVGTKQLKSNAVISSKVKDGSLKSADFASGQLPAGPQGAKGSKGDTGPQGPKGDTGPAGPEGTAKAYAYVNGSTGEVIDTKGVETAKENTGQYCIKVNFTPTNVVATTAASGTTVYVALSGLGGYGTCAGVGFLPGTNAFVVIRDASSTIVSDDNFFVAIN
jgi:hypothetical protein